MKIIDIMINSASRPYLLKKTLDSLRKHLVENEVKLRWIIHEAILIPDESDKNLIYINSLKLFNAILSTKKPGGEGLSIQKMLNATVSKYAIHWEDDFEALRDINLDEMYNIMETEDINQLVFNRRATMQEVAGWKKGEYKMKSGMFTTSPHWRYTPALWRLSYIKPLWESWKGSNSHWQLNKKIQKKILNDTKTHQWVHQNIKTYYYGPIGERGFCKHIGYGYSNRGKL